MLRSRWIRPTIVTNEDLVALGMPAYILFTGLWMMADRMGRLEDRPKRIKATIMPLWDEVCWQDVENLLEKLAGAGFIRRYEIGGKRYIQILNWHKHQKPNIREAAGTIPPAPSPSQLKRSKSASSDMAQPCTCNTVPCTCMHVQERLVTSYLLLERGVVLAPGSRESGAVENTPPKAENGTPKQPPGTAQTQASSTRDPPPSTDLALMRESLDSLAQQIHLPPPDDAMVRRILESGQGANAREVHDALVGLYKRQRFREIRSWGLVPLVVAQCFAA